MGIRCSESADVCLSSPRLSFLSPGRLLNRQSELDGWMGDPVSVLPDDGSLQSPCRNRESFFPCDRTWPCCHQIPAGVGAVLCFARALIQSPCSWKASSSSCAGPAFKRSVSCASDVLSLRHSVLRSVWETRPVLCSSAGISRRSGSDGSREPGGKQKQKTEEEKVGEPSHAF